MITVSEDAVQTLPKEVARGLLMAELRAACKRHQITQQSIADRCKVTRVFIVNVFAGRGWSARVVEEIRLMVAAAERRSKRGRK